MGNLIFCILHLLAIAFGVVGLFVTIPLHLIYSAASKPEKKKRGFIDGIIEGYTTKECPYCAETIKEEAILCKHCGKEFLVEKKETIIHGAGEKCCGACGAPNVASSVNCAHCGYKIY